MACFSVTDHIVPGLDMNTIIDEGNQTSTGTLASAAELSLFDMLGIPLYLDPPSFYYERGWGHEGLKPTRVLCS